MVKVYIRSHQFQHLYLLRRSATLRLDAELEAEIQAVSTPLPSEKVCDIYQKLVKVMGGKVSTPLPSEKVCDLLLRAVEDKFHSVSTPLPSEKVCDPRNERWSPSGTKFQHLYLLRRSATYCSGQ
uniref:hypothetical protein n=1 Tax=Synechococcus sp. C9 TaxID=102119 RepID=UPI0030D7480C